MASRVILSNFFEEQWTQNHPQYHSELSRALFLTTFLEIAVYMWLYTWRWCSVLVFHSTHSTSFWLFINNEMVTEKRWQSMAKKSWGTCLSADFFEFLLYHFCLRVQTNNLVYVIAGFVVSLQGFDEGWDEFLLAWVGHETPRENLRGFRAAWKRSSVSIAGEVGDRNPLDL